MILFSRGAGRGILGFVAAWWSIYAVLIMLLEPLGSKWFGSSPLPRLGPWGHILLLGLPIILAIVFLYLPSTLRATEQRKYLGIVEVSTGVGRTEAFQNICSRAQHRVVIVGIGMTNLAKYARKGLAQYAHATPIDLLMIDPEFLEANPHFAATLETFLDIPAFTASVRSSYESLKLFAEDWNAQADHNYKITLHVYRTIPTMSMVMIDPSHDTGELLIEFFLYQCGEYRPRFLIRQLALNAENNLFNRIRESESRLLNSARQIV
jgi:hypothetical protein